MRFDLFERKTTTTCVNCPAGKTSIGGDATTCAAEVTLAEYDHRDFDWAEPNTGSESYYKAPDITDSLSTTRVVSRVQLLGVITPKV